MIPFARVRPPPMPATSREQRQLEAPGLHGHDQAGDPVCTMVSSMHGDPLH